MDVADTSLYDFMLNAEKKTVNKMMVNVDDTERV